MTKAEKKEFKKDVIAVLNTVDDRSALNLIALSVLKILDILEPGRAKSFIKIYRKNHV